MRAAVTTLGLERLSHNFSIGRYGKYIGVALYIECTKYLVLVFLCRWIR